MNNSTSLFQRLFLLLSLLLATAGLAACGLGAGENDAEAPPTPPSVTGSDAAATAVPDKPSASPTPGPTNTPAPTATLLPTATPEPTITPTPAPTPMPVNIRSGTAAMALVDATIFSMGASADSLLAVCNEFRAGCDRGWFTASEPVHTVALDPYYIDVYEVSNAAYVEFLNFMGGHSATCDGQDCLTLHDSRLQSDGSGGYSVTEGFAEHPITGVTWYGAATFCAWRGARLPSEAEWEMAAGWDDAAGVKRLYPWGDEFDGTAVNSCDVNCAAPQAVARFDDGFAGTAPAGSFAEGVSPFGVYDMAGNVWEWVNDWFSADYYGAAPVTNPPGPAQGDAKVVRGGSWFDTGNFSATAVRFPAPPTESGDSIGFRCAQNGLPGPVMLAAAPAEEAVADESTSAGGTAPAITSPADGDALELDELTLTGSGAPDSAVTILDGGRVVGTAVVDGDGAWSLTFSVVPKRYELVARSADGALASDPVAVTVTATAVAITPTPAPTVVAAAATAHCVPGIDQGSTYVVGTCEWLSKIARALGIDYGALLAANPQITNPNLIFAGQVIQLPPRDGSAASASTAPPAPPMPTPAPPGGGLDS
jgi:formylglycine-generating enzyme